MVTFNHMDLYNMEKTMSGNEQNYRQFPKFSNDELLEMPDFALNNSICDFQSYIRQERKNGRSTIDAECECAYLLNERDNRNR